MSRDNALFALAGVLVGFVVAYFLYEAIGEKQPPRLPAAEAAAAGPMGAAPPGGPGGGAADPAALRREAERIEAFLGESPDVPQAWLQLGNLRFDAREYPAAAEAYRRYLALAPPDPDVLTDLGVAYHLMQRPDDALEQFAAAQRLAPDHWQSRFNEVVVLAFDLGRYDEASRVLDELRELQPGNPDVERLAAEVERRRGA